MKYDILFYKSKKTSYCEKALIKKLSEINMSENRVIASVAPQKLGEILCESLTLCNTVIIVGGFSINDSENIVTVLSRAMSNSGLTLNNTRKLKGVNEYGYIIKYSQQIIIALPDDPVEINAMIDDGFANYLRTIYDL